LGEEVTHVPLLRNFWSEELTSKEFLDLSTEGYRWILAYDIQRQHQLLETNRTEDLLPVFTNPKRDIATDPIFGRMATAYVRMVDRIPLPRKDVFYEHFSGALAYALIACVTQAFPKHRDLFESPEFRQRTVRLFVCLFWN
jgi:hypothetical protein